MNDNNQNNNQNPNQQKRKIDLAVILVIIVLIIGGVLLIRGLTSTGPTTLTLNAFEEYVTETDTDKKRITGELSAVPAGENNEGLYTISGKMTDGTSFTLVVTTETLNTLMTEDTYSSIHITISTLSDNLWLTILINVVPFILMIGLFFLMLRSTRGDTKAFDFAKSTARLSRGKSVTFKDVAGCDEEKQELEEIIDFLKNPKKYAEIGARVPKGVLLFGPPGTGKTLLAKAVAGEAGVPFFSISGSDFVEMFVGVGASRVRDMFKTAKQNAPCIIFIDEIDAVGRQRGAGMGGGHDEREQTLNQLLVEMDGFNGNLGIIVMAATNRPDVLDPALLRPGRFDRQITIDAPDVKGREAILKVHARNKHLESNINLDDVAHRIPGFTGADIENLLNEAALLAARNNRKIINIQDIDEAMDRVMMGPAKKSKKYTDKERRMVAYHEAGHAVIGIKLENASKVQKVTIIPRGQAGGYNLMTPKEETFTQTKQQLLDSITGYLGGRVAEELMFNEISTGAYGDIKSATKLARAMVTEYGMSDLGPIQYEERQGSVFLGRDYLKDKNFSDAVASEIDAEVRKIMLTCHNLATETIKNNMDLLANIAEYLLKVETITAPEIDEIVATGHLKWYDEKEAKKAAEEAAKASAEATTDTTATTEAPADTTATTTDTTTPAEEKKDNE